MLMNLIDNIKEQVDKESFSAKIPLSLSVGSEDLEDYSKDVMVFFDIEQIWRDWGLASMQMIFTKPVEVSYTPEGGESSTVVLDLNDAVQEFVRGEGFTPNSLDVTLKSDGKLQYMSIEISKFLEYEV